MTAFRLLRSATTALTAATMLAGCTVGPNFERPAAPSTTAYTSPSDVVTNPASGPAMAFGAGPRIAWTADGPG